MSAATSRRSRRVARDIHALRSLCLELGNRVRAAKRLLDEEIRNYPTPITRCDAQFNFLYERRAHLAGALERLDTVAGESGAPANVARLVAELVRAAPYVGGAEEKRLLAGLRAELGPR